MNGTVQACRRHYEGLAIPSKFSKGLRSIGRASRTDRSPVLKLTVVRSGDFGVLYCRYNETMTSWQALCARQCQFAHFSLEIKDRDALCDHQRRMLLPTIL